MTEIAKPKKFRLNREDILGKVQTIIGQYGAMKLTIRQIYYRLVAVYALRNCLTSYQFVGDVIRDGRLNGDIDFESIEDRTRAVHEGERSKARSIANYFRDYYDYIKDFEDTYYMPKWWGQPKRVVVMVEKQALAALFQQITDRWGVDLIVNRGYPSLTLMWELSNRMKEHEDIEEMNIVYYGDFDPSGVDIERHVGDTLMDDFENEFKIGRIAITKEQIQKYNIPPAPAKRTDSRFEGFVAETGVAWQVELDAIEPKMLQGMVEDSIKRYFDFDLQKDQREEQERRRGELKEWKDGWINKTFKPPERDSDDEEEDDEEEDKGEESEE